MAVLSFTKTFEWNVRERLAFNKSFAWRVGDGPLHWYRVESMPYTGICDNLAKGVNNTLIQTILASSVENLCKRLTDTRFHKKIKKVGKWTRPALECDVINDQKLGISHDCNELRDVDFCICQCGAFIDDDDDCSFKFKNLIWYTEYYYLTNTVVSIGDLVVLGQKLGEVTDFLRFGIGDGQTSPTGCGQTSDIRELFGLPGHGDRDPDVDPPGSSFLSEDDMCFIGVNTRYPIDIGRCNWGVDYTSDELSGFEYYAMDLNCYPLTPNMATGAEVYCACGGFNITSTVEDIITTGDGDLVLISHQVDDPLNPIFTMAANKINRSYFAPEEPQLIKQGFKLTHNLPLLIPKEFEVFEVLSEVFGDIYVYIDKNYFSIKQGKKHFKISNNIIRNDFGFKDIKIERR